MANISRILVPLDGSEHSLKALPIASKIARVYEAELALLLVTYFAPDTDDNSTSETWLDTPLTGSVSRYSKSVFQRATNRLATDLTVTTHQLSGQPQEQILHFIGQYNINLVVVGCRRWSLFDKLINGSVSRHIVEKATCPVIIVK